MANQEQLKILKQGVSTWNDWRTQNYSVSIDFSSANLEKMNLSGALLDSANFSGANLKEAVFIGSRLLMANFRNADLTSANLQAANLFDANFSNSRFVNVDVKNANLSNVNLENANVYNVKFNRWAKYQGIRLSGSHGSFRFVRYAMDQSFIEEFRGPLRLPRKGYAIFHTDGIGHIWSQVINYIKIFPSPKQDMKFWIFYLPWLILSDCGRSFILWLFWSVLFALFFGAIYANYPVPSWLPDWLTLRLLEVAPHITIDRPMTGFTPYYFSIVTFTTLGFGDVLPRNLAGEIWLTIEVILGYVMLGGLISILANKVTRRA